MVVWVGSCVDFDWACATGGCGQDDGDIKRGCRSGQNFVR